MIEKNIPGECPFCGKYTGIYQVSDYTDDSYYDLLSCENCGARWTEKFSYSGFEIVENPLDEKSLKV